MPSSSLVEVEVEVRVEVGVEVGVGVRAAKNISLRGNLDSLANISPQIA